MGTQPLLAGILALACGALALRGLWSDAREVALDAPRAELLRRGANADERIAFALGADAELYRAIVAARPERVYWLEDQLRDKDSVFRFFRVRTLLYPTRVHALRDLPPGWMPPPGALGARDLVVDAAPEAEFAPRALLDEVARGDGWTLRRLRVEGAGR